MIPANALTRKRPEPTFFDHMYALVCIGGDAPPAPFLRNLAAAADLVIAADSGLSIALDAGLRVDHAIGDMDSLADPSLLAGLPPDRVHRHPP